MHGTMGGNNGGGGLGQATVAAGATLPRRRGPFGCPTTGLAPGQPGCYLPPNQPQVPPSVVNTSMANRPLPVAGAFDPNNGRPLVPPPASNSTPIQAQQQSRLPDKEVGI